MSSSSSLSAPIGTLIVNPAPRVRPDQRLSAVAHLMGETGSGIVLVDDHGHVAGAIKHQNMIAAIAAAEDLDTTSAAEAMTNVYIRLESSLPIIEAAAVMADDGSAAVVILDQGRPLGVVSMIDIIDHVTSPLR